MGNSEFIKYCKKFVVDYVNSTEYVLPSGYTPRIFDYNVFVVWISKVLQNNKALLSTTVDGDTRYYEITYNGDKEATKMSFISTHMIKSSTSASQEKI